MEDYTAVVVETLSKETANSDEYKEWLQSYGGQRQLIAFFDGYAYVWVCPRDTAEPYGLRRICLADRHSEDSDTLVEIQVIGSGQTQLREVLGDVQEIVLSRTGKHVILACTASVFVAKMPVSGAKKGLLKIREVVQLGSNRGCMTGFRVLGVAWHSLCRFQSTVLVLSSDNALRLYDVRDVNRKIDGIGLVASAEQIFQLPHSTSLSVNGSPLAAVAFALPSVGCAVARMTVYVLLGSGAVGVICPVLPKNIMVPCDVWNQVVADIEEKDDVIGQQWVDSFEVEAGDEDDPAPVYVMRKRQGNQAASSVALSSASGYITQCQPLCQMARLQDIELTCPCAITVLNDEPVMLAVGSANGDMAIAWLSAHVMPHWATHSSDKDQQRTLPPFMAVPIELTYKADIGNDEGRGGAVTVRNQLASNGIVFSPADYDDEDLAAERGRLRYPIMSLVPDAVHPDRVYALHALGISVITVTFLETLLDILTTDSLSGELPQFDAPEERLLCVSLSQSESLCCPTMGACAVLDPAIGYKLLVATAIGTEQCIEIIPLVHTAVDSEGVQNIDKETESLKGFYREIFEQLTVTKVQPSRETDIATLSTGQVIEELQKFRRFTRVDLSRMADSVDKLVERQEAMKMVAKAQMDLIDQLMLSIKEIDEKQTSIRAKAIASQQKGDALQETLLRLRADAQASTPLTDEERAYHSFLLKTKRDLSQISIDRIAQVELATHDLAQLPHTHLYPPLLRSESRDIKEITAKLASLSVGMDTLRKEAESLKKNADLSQEEKNWDRDYAPSP